MDKGILKGMVFLRKIEFLEVLAIENLSSFLHLLAVD
jgi:hypothetical protein